MRRDRSPDAPPRRAPAKVIVAVVAFLLAMSVLTFSLHKSGKRTIRANEHFASTEGAHAPGGHGHAGTLDDPIPAGQYFSEFDGKVAPGDERLMDCDGKIQFERDVVANCEGYWRDRAALPASRKGEGLEPLPFPVKQPVPFCGERAWLKRLKYIEARVKEEEEKDATAPTPLSEFNFEGVPTAPTGVTRQRQRGLSTSRIDGSFLGNTEYSEEAEGGRRMCWTGDLAAHYVEKYHVVPSYDFYTYVIVKFRSITADIE
jgi:hypothetical protein